MIDYLQLAIDHKRVSFMWNNQLIEGVVYDYDDPDDEEIGPAIIALDNNNNSRSYKAYEIPEISDLKVLD